MTDAAPRAPATEELICLALHSAARASEASYKPVLTPFRLTYPKYLVLMVLWQDDGVSVGEIGRRLFLDSGTLTPLVKRLEIAGLVMRRRDTSDERVVRVYLTPGGRALHEPVTQAVGVMARGLNLSPGEICDLRDRIKLLRRLMLDLG